MFITGRMKMSKMSEVSFEMGYRFADRLMAVRKDANCGFIRDWEVAEDSEGMRHIFVQDPFTLEWFEAYNEGKYYSELCGVCHA